MKQRIWKKLSLLITMALLCVSFVVPSALAVTTDELPCAYIISDGTDYFLIDFEELFNSYLGYTDDPNSDDAKLAKFYFDTLGNDVVTKFIAYQSTATGKCVKYEQVLFKYIDTADLDKTYEWFNSQNATPAFQGATKVKVLGPDGSVSGNICIGDNGYEQYNGDVAGTIETTDTGEVKGTLTGDFALTVEGQIADTGSNVASFEGTVSGDINGGITASVNANGIDTMSGTISGTGATQPVRIIGTFPQTGTDGDFVGEIITGPLPTYVDTMSITSEADATALTVGDTLQLNVDVTPAGAADEVLWSVYVNHRDIGSINDDGLLTGLAPGSVTVIAKALDGSLKDATKTFTVAAPEYNGNVAGTIKTSDAGVVTGTLNGDFELTVQGQVTDTGSTISTFEGRVSGDINGEVMASVNANGIDTMSGTISGTGAVQPVRIIGTFPQTGTDGDFVGEIITGPLPTYVDTISITSEDDATTLAVGDTLQLDVEATPAGATDEVLWSVYVNHRDIGSINDDGLLTGLAPGSVTVIAKALDGSLKDATKTFTVASVVNETKDTGYTTISAAIDAASDGNTILVGSGTYGQVVIDKPNLTLKSVVQHQAIIDASADTASNSKGIKIGMPDLGAITIDGFQVQGWNGHGICQLWSNRTGTIVQVINNYIVAPEDGPLAYGNSIQVSEDGCVVNGNKVEVTGYHNPEEDWGTTGIAVFGKNSFVNGNEIEYVPGGYEPNETHGIGTDTSDITMSNNTIKGVTIGIKIDGYAKDDHIIEASNTFIDVDYETVDVHTDLMPPKLDDVSPAEGVVVLGDGQTFQLTVDVSDDNLYELEIDHSLSAVLPEFSVYADEANPYGTMEDKAGFISSGVTVTYDAAQQVWTIDFGEDVTGFIVANGGITFYIVIKDEAGNAFGTMYGTTSENTLVYKVS